MMQQFDEIRPYNDKEMQEAIQRIAAHPYFRIVIDFLFSNTDIEHFKDEFCQLQSIHEFQKKIMKEAIWAIVKKTSSGLDCSGFESLEKSKHYMFLGNHRDILLDSALLQILLFKYELKTSEITFGSNLMQNDFVTDIGKLNKMFKIARDGNLRDLYKDLHCVSSYMRYNITQKEESVWIAQRNGRTKNGSDLTETAVLKMFSLSSNLPFVENLSELNITPLAVSYEFEPCDFLKTGELYIRRRRKYVKALNEDLNSILTGITQWKGRIYLAVANTVTASQLMECENTSDKYMALGKLIDHQIYTHYKLWPNNYIAHDMLHQSQKHSAHYNQEEKEKFVQYMEDGLQKMEGEQKELQEIFLGIYANPVDKCLL